MLRVTELKVGRLISINSQPHEILESSHSNIGRGAAIVKTKLKNLKTNSIFEKTFKGQDRIEEAFLDFVPCQFIYRRGSDFYFMDSVNFEEFFLSKDRIGKNENFLKDGLNLDVVFSKKEPITLKLPIKINFIVKDAAPGIKGDTASSATKEVTIETDYKLQVPLFIKKGDTIRVDTRTGEYIGRLK